MTFTNVEVNTTISNTYGVHILVVTVYTNKIITTKYTNHLFHLTYTTSNSIKQTPIQYNVFTKTLLRSNQRVDNAIVYRTLPLAPDTLRAHP